MRCVFLVRSEEGRGKVICTSHCCSAESAAFLRSKTALVFTCSGRLTAIGCMTLSYSRQERGTRQRIQGRKTSLHLLQARCFFFPYPCLILQLVERTHSLHATSTMEILSSHCSTDRLPPGDAPQISNFIWSIHYLQQFRKKYNHFILTITVSILTVQPNVGWQHFFRLK